MYVRRQVTFVSNQHAQIIYNNITHAKRLQHACHAGAYIHTDVPVTLC